MPERRKSMTGTVVSDKMDKTVVVVVATTTRHRLYHKILRRSKRYLAHDDRFEAKPGDLVRILETRPLSRHKRWRVAEIIRRGEVAEIAPREIDSEYLAREREVESPPPLKPRVEEEAAIEATAAEAPAEPAEASVEEAPAAEETVEQPEASVEETPAVEEPVAEEEETAQEETGEDDKAS